MKQITAESIKEMKRINIFHFLNGIFKDLEKYQYNFYHNARLQIQEEFSIPENEAIEFRDLYFSEGTREKYFLDHYIKLKALGEQYLKYINKQLTKVTGSTTELIDSNKKDILKLEFQILLDKVISVRELEDKSDYYTKSFVYLYVSNFFESWDK